MSDQERFMWTIGNWDRESVKRRVLRETKQFFWLSSGTWPTGRRYDRSECFESHAKAVERQQQRDAESIVRAEEALRRAREDAASPVGTREDIGK